ncbi:MAG: chloramphenicol-sensitive protein RarD [Myxococcota bacterium]|jgi:chloramphenicol-sensitive protein RarD
MGVTPPSIQRTGIVYGVLAFGLWGLLPIFWKQLGSVPSLEQTLYRLVFGAVTFALGALLFGQWREVRQLLEDRKKLRWFVLSGLLISTNWLVFLYAVESERMVESSLGYYLNPLLNVLLGTLLLGERLSRLRWVAVGVAALGVLGLVVVTGTLPWIALVLAGSFASYGLVRKQAPASAMVGSTVELGLLIPIALGVLVWRGGGALATASPWTASLILLTGVATAVPIGLFVASARRVPLSTLGFLQFLAPTLQLLLGVVVYGEAFGPTRASCFVVIWLACALFSVEAVRPDRARQSSG